MIAYKKWVNEQLYELKNWCRGFLSREVARYIDFELKRRKDEEQMKAAHEAIDASVAASRDLAGAVMVGIDMAAPSPPKWECGCWGCHSYRAMGFNYTRMVERVFRASYLGRQFDKPEPDDGRTPHCDSKKLRKLEQKVEALLSNLGMATKEIPAANVPAYIELVPVRAQAKARVRRAVAPKKPASKRK